jgi:hypothetical protein
MANDVKQYRVEDADWRPLTDEILELMQGKQTIAVEVAALAVYLSVNETAQQYPAATRQARCRLALVQATARMTQLVLEIKRMDDQTVLSLMGNAAVGQGARSCQLQ